MVLAVGAALTTFGGFINDYYASKREARQQERENQRLKEQRESEGRGRLREGRLRAYAHFAEATASLGAYAHTPERREVLTRSFVETQLYASDLVSLRAKELYEAAMEMFESTEVDVSSWEKLDSARDMFLVEVRNEYEQGD